MHVSVQHIPLLAGKERNFSLLLPCHLSFNSSSEIFPTEGSVPHGIGGGNLTLSPHIVVLFFISRPHLKRFLLLVRTDKMFSLLSDLETEII